MENKSEYYPGLNIYRALAMLLMMMAHSARIQTDMGALYNQPSLAHFWDWPLLSTLLIEPIISAMFLFIAGFSLVLSQQKQKKNNSTWLWRLGNRMLTLYAISVIFYVADRGFQLPDLLISSGVLGVIALGLFTAGAALCTKRATPTLLAMAFATLGLALILEQSKSNVVGLNAGAGGMIPLISLAYLGSLCGLVWLRWRNNGLLIVLAVASILSIFALQEPAPWISYPTSKIAIYEGDRVTAVFNSILDLFGLYHGVKQEAEVRYWNHSWIFVVRCLPLLVLGMLISLNSLKTIKQPILIFANWMGTQALNFYVLHLLLLAAVEVLGAHTHHGWQTLFLVCAVLATSAWLLRYISIVPLGWVGNTKTAK